LTLLIEGLSHVREIRRDRALDLREMEALRAGIDLRNPYIRRARDIQLSGPGRQLERSGKGYGGQGQ